MNNQTNVNQVLQIQEQNLNKHANNIWMFGVAYSVVTLISLLFIKFITIGGESVKMGEIFQSDELGGLKFFYVVTWIVAIGLGVFSIYFKDNIINKINQNQWIKYNLLLSIVAIASSTMLMAFHLIAETDVYYVDRKNSIFWLFSIVCAFAFFIKGLLMTTITKVIEKLKPYATICQNVYQSQPNEYQPQPSGYQSQPNGYQPQPNGYQPQPNGYQLQPNGYQPQPNGYQPQPNGYQPQPNGYQPQPNGYQPQPNGYQPQLNVYQSQSNEYQAQPNGYQPQPNVYQSQSNEYQANELDAQTSDNVVLENENVATKKREIGTYWECQNCGAENDLEYKTCPECGKKR